VETPTSERLALALIQVGAPPQMVTHAREGYYDDYRSPLAMPIMQLVHDARAAGLEKIADRAIDGEFDATKEESDAWMASDDGQATLRALLGGIE
jgi:hypothetical protein